MSVESATRARLQQLDELDSPLGQIAITLALSLDDGAGMAAAAISKELRATLKELTPHDSGDDFQKLMDELSTTVRHT